MITEEILLKKGYKKFINSYVKDTESDTYACSYQKRFDDEIGKKYFITLDLHDCYYALSIFTSEHIKLWSVNVQFYIQKEATFKVEYFIYDNTTIQMIEAFYEKLWGVMGCKYYEKWDEC